MNTSLFPLTAPSDLGLAKLKRPNPWYPLNMILLAICAQETRGLEAKIIPLILTPTHLSMTLLRCCLDLLPMLPLPPTQCLRASPSTEAVMSSSSTHDTTWPWPRWILRRLNVSLLSGSVYIVKEARRLALNMSRFLRSLRLSIGLETLLILCQ